jgi:hypothetical protein
MILDDRLEFCDATSLNTGAAGSYLIGDVVDLGAANATAPNGGDGDSTHNLRLCIQVDTAVTSGGAATVAFSLCSDAQAAIAVDGTQTVHFTTAVIPKATLVAGYQACAISLPHGNYERYLGVVQVTGTAALTAGKVNAFLTNVVPVIKAYDSPSQG